MNRTILVFSLLLLSASLSAQVGNIFPDMPTETAEDKKVKLPTDTKGKYTLLGVAYSKKSEEELNTWFKPIFEKFIQKATGIMAGFAYDVNVYFVPMMTGVNAAATGKAKKNALENVDPKLLPHILFYKGELKPYKEALGFDSKELPYFYVLDPEGKIVFSTSGKYTPKKMDELEAVIE